MRNVGGGLLAVLGAAVTLGSPWQAWYNGRHGSTYKFWEVFGSGITGSKSGIMDSVFLVFLVTAIVTAIGAVLRSRALVIGAGVVALGFTILWMVRQGSAAGELTVSSNSRGVGFGVATALIGGLLMIIGGLVMTGLPREVVVDDRTRTRAGGATAATTTRDRESNVIPADPPASSAPPRPAPQSERTGTERLSKEERELLGLDQDAPSPPRRPEK